MYIVGKEEIDAVTRVIESGKLFRYNVGDECDRFERRYAEFLGAGISRSPPAAAMRWSPPWSASASAPATRC